MNPKKILRKQKIHRRHGHVQHKQNPKRPPPTLSPPATTWTRSCRAGRRRRPRDPHPLFERREPVRRGGRKVVEYLLPAPGEPQGAFFCHPALVLGADGVQRGEAVVRAGDGGDGRGADGAGVGVLWRRAGPGPSEDAGVVYGHVFRGDRGRHSEVSGRDGI